MLTGATVTAFVATADPTRSRAFYAAVLGLVQTADDEFATAYDCAGIQLRVQKVPVVRPHPYTALGWQVPSLHDAVLELRARGVVFERYAGLEQDELGIWRAPSGTQVAWFRDPDGNLLSASQSR